MFKAEDILIRLQNGEDVGAIASEMTETLNAIANEVTEALNAANDQFQKEQAAKAKEEEAKARNANKVAAMQEILDKTYAFLIEFYCEDDKDLDAVEQLFEELDATTAIEMIDEAMDCVAELAKIEQVLGKLVLPAAPKEKKASKISKDASADVVINNFLASLGLK